MIKHGTASSPLPTKSPPSRPREPTSIGRRIRRQGGGGQGAWRRPALRPTEILARVSVPARGPTHPAARRRALSGPRGPARLRGFLASALGRPHRDPSAHMPWSRPRLRTRLCASRMLQRSPGTRETPCEPWPDGDPFARIAWRHRKEGPRQRRGRSAVEQPRVHGRPVRLRHQAPRL